MKRWRTFGVFNFITSALGACVLVAGLYACDTFRQVQVLGDRPTAITTRAVAFSTNSIILVHSFDGSKSISHRRIPEAIIYFHNNPLIRYEVDGESFRETDVYTAQEEVTLELFFKLEVSSGDSLLIDPSVYLNLPLPLPLTLVVSD